MGEWMARAMGVSGAPRALWDTGDVDEHGFSSLLRPRAPSSLSSITFFSCTHSLPLSRSLSEILPSSTASSGRILFYSVFDFTLAFSHCPLLLSPYFLALCSPACARETICGCAMRCAALTRRSMLLVTPARRWLGQCAPCVMVMHASESLVTDARFGAAG